VGEVEATGESLPEAYKPSPMFGGKRVVWLKTSIFSRYGHGRAESTLKLVEDLQRFSKLLTRPRRRGGDGPRRSTDGGRFSNGAKKTAGFYSGVGGRNDSSRARVCGRGAGEARALG